MKKSIRPFLAGAICFVGIYGWLWGFGWMIQSSFDRSFGRSGVVSLNDTPSPNQTYIATTFTDSGGGAAGWCARVVAVRKNNEQFDPDHNRVFNSQCDSDVKVAWKDERDLLITVSTSTNSL